MVDCREFDDITIDACLLGAQLRREAEVTGRAAWSYQRLLKLFSRLILIIIGIELPSVSFRWDFKTVV